MATTARATPATTPPSAFHCPISLDLMTDPVTLSTGITYDRPSIQHWLASGHSTCPVTRQPLDPSTPFFIPNHTLLRIIRTWSRANLPAAALPAEPTLSSGEIRLGEFCTAALHELRIGPHAASLVAPYKNAIPLHQAASLLASLLSHYRSQACQGQALAVRTCEEAVATLSLLRLTAHDLTALAQSEVVHCLSCLLQSIERQARLNSAYLLAKLLSHDDQHPTQIKPFLRTLASHLPALAHGLVQILMHSDPSRFLVQDILDCLCLLCRSSRTTTLSLTEVPAGLLYIILEQLLQSAHQGGPESTMISEKALSLLEIMAFCAEGRAAIASHAFAVPTIAKALYRNVSEVATESAVVVLWKLCRYSSNVDRVRRQAMEASVPSKLMLLLQALLTLIFRMLSNGRGSAEAAPVGGQTQPLDPCRESELSTNSAMESALQSRLSVESQQAPLCKAQGGRRLNKAPTYKKEANNCSIALLLETENSTVTFAELEL